MKNIYLFIFALVFLFACGNKNDQPEAEGLTLSKAMGEVNDENFNKATDIIEFEFPKDHGPHLDFRTEWWYFTGNLSDETGRMFGYQFTIFRTGLTVNNIERKSDWSSTQIYMGHFAVTDIANDRFYFDEIFSREGNKLAGAQADPFKVWLENWELHQFNNNIKFDLPSLNISAQMEDVSINLDLSSIKPKVLQGDKGLSQKGSKPGNASYYYSYTRLQTEGEIKIGSSVINVSGNSWLDREWSTSALSEDQAGWDWFALQLSDTTEIMYYQMRKVDGSADNFSKGVLVNKGGASELIKKDDVTLTVTETWESPIGRVYPSGWQLQIPEKNIFLNISPAVKTQLMDVSLPYWEGSVIIEGSKAESKISGRGYVELTGY